jgi:hypothetical protein
MQFCEPEKKRNKNLENLLSLSRSRPRERIREVKIKLAERKTERLVKIPLEYPLVLLSLMLVFETMPKLCIVSSS